jgi:thioredoxin reductase (NADPH)
VCIEGYESGGQIARSGRVENFPGFPGGISGAELGEKIRQQASDFGATFRSEDVESVDFTRPRLRVVSAGGVYDAEAVIVASGARARRLGLESEDEFDGRGVCYCAICDGPFFADLRVVVVGGGDAAAEEALALSGIASSVDLVHRRTEFRANATLRAAVAERPNIRVFTPNVVTEILGGDLGVTGARLRDVDTGTETTVDADGVFVAIGHVPASGCSPTGSTPTNRASCKPPVREQPPGSPVCSSPVTLPTRDTARPSPRPHRAARRLSTPSGG